MSKIDYHRWSNNFILDEFSSEDSMRDYLFSNSTLLFNEKDIIFPIGEEKALPQSSLANKQSGRADLILCRLLEESEIENGKLSLENIEIWVIELKKMEATYSNGFEQLFDYLSIINNNKNNIQENIKNELKKAIKKNRHRDIEFKDSNGTFSICGSLVAPSFDLFTRTHFKDIITKGSNPDFQALGQGLIKTGIKNEGFTLLDIMYTAQKLFGKIKLQQLLRFRRSDEIIIYSENVLGSKAEAATLSRVDPIDLFNRGILKEDQVFYFRDTKGNDHKEVRCKVINGRGRSHSFILELKEIPGSTEIKFPIIKWNKGKKRNEFLNDEIKKLPIGDGVKNISIALHDYFSIYNNKEELANNYFNHGEQNFVRENDEKTLSEIRDESR